jgi:hypothetical protein
VMPEGAGNEGVVAIGQLAVGQAVWPGVTPCGVVRPSASSRASCWTGVRVRAALVLLFLAT